MGVVGSSSGHFMDRWFIFLVGGDGDYLRVSRGGWRYILVGWGWIDISYGLVGVVRGIFWMGGGGWTFLMGGQGWAEVYFGWVWVSGGGHSF